MKYKKIKITPGMKIPLGSIVVIKPEELGPDQRILIRYTDSNDKWYYDLSGLEDGNGWCLPKTPQLSKLATANKPLPLKLLVKNQSFKVIRVWRPIGN